MENRGFMGSIKKSGVETPQTPAISPTSPLSPQPAKAGSVSGQASIPAADAYTSLGPQKAPAARSAKLGGVFGMDARALGLSMHEVEGDVAVSAAESAAANSAVFNSPFQPAYAEELLGYLRDR